MSSDEMRTKTRKALRALLLRLKISKVVCVDDEHTTEPTLEDIIPWLNDASLEDIAITFPGFEGREQRDEEVRSAMFRQWWDTLPVSEKKQLASEIREKIQKDESEEYLEFHCMTELSEILTDLDGVEYLPLDLSQWLEKREDLLSKPECEHTLFLFDQDMSKSNGRENEGSTIIGSIFTTTNNRTLCGILTHTADIQKQVECWDKLAQEADVARDKFIVIPKELLKKDPIEFVRQVKSAVLIPSFRQLKETTFQILENSLKTAKRELENLNVLDFDHMVMRIAYGEGLWEGQVLFRLHTHFYRNNAEQEARNNVEISSLLEKIRQVSNIPAFGKETASDVVRGIRHDEIYEDGNSINQAHLNIVTGDMFESLGSGNGEVQRWLLITQSCDLMLRPNGKRKAKQALVLSVKEYSKDEWEKNKSNPRYMELEYYDKAGNSAVKAVDFVFSSYVPCWMLDTCVLNQNGCCDIRLDTTLPSGLLPGWEKYFPNLLKEAKELYSQYEFSNISKEEERNGLLERLTPVVTSCGEVRAVVTNDEVKIPMKRVKRLRNEFAVEIVRQYALYIARTPLEVNLARDV